MACVARDEAAREVDSLEKLCGQRPIRSDGDMNIELQLIAKPISSQPRSRFVAAVSVQENDPSEPLARQRRHDVGQYVQIRCRTEAYRAAERNVMVGESKGQRWRKQHQFMCGGKLDGALRDRGEDGCIGS